MSRSCPQSEKSEGHAGCQTCRANSIPIAFPSAGESTTRIECRGIVFPSPMIDGQCQRLPVQPYRGSDCNGPGTDSTRLLCHLGRFKLPQAECWRGRSLLGRRRAVSRGLKQPYPNHLMNAPRKPFPDLIPEDPHIFQQKNVLNSARRARYPRVWVCTQRIGTRRRNWPRPGLKNSASGAVRIFVERDTVQRPELDRVHRDSMNSGADRAHT
jgi:hypothetical protein